MAVYCPSELHLVKTKDPVVFMLPLAYAYNNNACCDDHQGAVD